MVFIIAEAGVNHNGSLETALEMVDVAKKSGADAIKFQTFKSELLTSPKAEKANYQKETTGINESQLEMIQKLELTYEDFRKVYNKCEEVGIKFISTPFDLDSVDFLNSLPVDIFKIGSGDLTNWMLLKKVLKTGKKIILSTGMSNMNEVNDTINFLHDNNFYNYVILHCVSCYPTKHDDLNLKSITTLKNEYPKNDIGFSDHTLGNKASIYSVCLGATYIEKHFTLDKKMEGPDHRASLNPEELYNFVSEIKECEIMLGNGEKRCRPNEIEVRDKVRRSLFVNKDLKSGYKIKEEDLIALRPYDGICSSKYKEYIGKELTRDMQKYDYIEDLLEYR